MVCCFNKGHICDATCQNQALLSGGSKPNSLSRSIDLAKLNPNCHINYSVIFTEISFYPEISSS